MKKPIQQVSRYDISPLAKAGIIVQNMEAERNVKSHDVFSPHRDLHYMLVVLRSGMLTFKLDFEDAVLDSAAVLLIQPGQVHQILDFKEPKGWVVEFDSHLIDNHLQFVLSAIFSKSDPVLNNYLSLEVIKSLLVLMETVQLQPQPKKTLFHLLMAIFSLIVNCNQRTEDFNSSASRPYEIQQSFAALLSMHFKEWKQPSKYAGSLSITTAHLNDTIKQLTGISVSEHIQERSILEAKRLLFFTDLSVKEIGYDLGYNEPVYFGKLFKKVSNTSPLQFRRKFRDQDY